MFDVSTPPENEDDMGEDTARELGRLEGRVEGLEGRIDRFEESIITDLKEIKASLTAIATVHASQNGAIRVAHYVGLVFAGAFGWIASRLFHVTLG